MDKKTKTLTFYEFFYPDSRPNATAAFAGNGFIVDAEEGDTVEVTGSYPNLTHTFTKKDGMTADVPPGWLWMEHYTKEVPITPSASTNILR